MCNESWVQCRRQFALFASPMHHRDFDFGTETQWGLIILWMVWSRIACVDAQPINADNYGRR
jgi:hypothetical protein